MMKRGRKRLKGLKVFWPGDQFVEIGNVKREAGVMEYSSQGKEHCGHDIAECGDTNEGNGGEMKELSGILRHRRRQT